MTLRISDLNKQAIERLRGAGVSNARQEIGWIWTEGLGKKPAEVTLHEAEASEEEAGLFFEMIAKREARIPLAYVLGEASFFDEKLKVTKDCLVPRSDTETLILALLEKISPEAAIDIIDIGTGSGCIAIALLRKLKKARALLVDVSEDALKIAEQNLNRYNLKERSNVLKSNLFSAVRPGQSFDLIVSNPPYLCVEDFKKAQPEILIEPRIALDGGPNGLLFYKRLATNIDERLRPGGRLAVEVGQGQSEAVSKIFKEGSLEEIEVKKDLSGISRVVLGRKKSDG